jgi:hypothetical protein
MNRSPFRGFALLLVCAAAGALGIGCKQTVGGRCVQDSDCTTGICSFYGETASAGRCESPAPVTTPDASATGGAGDTGGVGGVGGVGGTGGAAGGTGGRGTQDASVGLDARLDVVSRVDVDARSAVDALGHDARSGDARSDL